MSMSMCCVVLCCAVHVNVLFIMYRYTGEDYGAKQSGEKVLPAQIDPLSKQNFPLCMKSMQEVLNTSHHIKYKVNLTALAVSSCQ